MVLLTGKGSSLAANKPVRPQGLVSLGTLQRARYVRRQYEYSPAISKTDQDHQTIAAVGFSPAIAERPFVMLRSMYITEFNKDVSQIAVRGRGTGWTEGNIIAFKGARAADIWVGKLVPSMHNTFPPDVALANFSSSDLPQPIWSASAPPASE